MWDDQCCDLYGLPPGTPMPTFEDWLEMIHPDDREAAAAEVQKGHPAREEFSAEFRIRHPQRGERWLVMAGGHREDPRGQA